MDEQDLEVTKTKRLTGPSAPREERSDCGSAPFCALTVEVVSRSKTLEQASGRVARSQIGLI
jgi:hypothetical protein